MLSLKFTPEYIFEKFSDASAEFLQSIGIKGIILDVDNTLEPYEHAKPGEHVIRWLEELKSSGISAAIVSNNNSKRIDMFNEELDLFAISKAGKPFPANVRRAIEALGCSPNEVILMGDQVFTDVWAAHNAGIRAILVPPINDKRDLLTKFKRWLEKPILRQYFKTHEEI
jgi:HAD superfamily phosphatase (TIGR01668 family)